MKRLNQIMDHMSVSHADSTEMKSLKRRLELQSLKAYFRLSEDKLKEMSYFMLHEMHKGLESEQKQSTLRMLPSFVYRKDVSSVCGTIYALDLGGTNFRVIRMDLHEGRLQRQTALKFKIPESAMCGQKPSDLFGFIADCIAKFQKVKGPGDAPQGQRSKVGFTFSFPTQQHDINKGSLIAWTKGFTTKGVIGENLVQLLQTEIDQRNLNIDVVALCNDTVGTLVAKYFSDPQAEVGVILGTGSNACYWEQTSRVTKSNKCLEAAKTGKKEVVINMEFGNFDSKDLLVLPRTPFDDEIDRNSPNPGAQRFEKMISGFYQGEIVRLILVRLSKNHILPPHVAERLTKRNEFRSESVSMILGDRLPGRHMTEEVMANYGAPLPDLRHRYMVHDVCALVVHRAAQLAGMAIGATLLKAGKQHNATVAIDGSVYEKTPTFRHILERSVHQVVGPDCDIRLTLQRDGSGFGAGFIAALQ